MIYHKFILTSIFSLIFTCIYSQNDLSLEIDWKENTNFRILICSLKNKSENSILIGDFENSSSNRIVITDTLNNVKSFHFTYCTPTEKREVAADETIEWEYDTGIYFYSSDSIVKRKRPTGQHLIFWVVNGFKSNVVEYLHE